MSCTIPIVVVSSLIFARLITKETEAQLSTYSKAGQIAQEVFSSLRTVLSFNESKSQQKQYDKELKLNEWCTVRKDIAFGAFFGWLIFINFLVYSIGFTFGSILMSYGNHRTLTISEILVIVNMFAQALGYLNNIGPFFQSISEAQGAAVSVFRLIDEVHDENINEREILQENISNDRFTSNINGDIEFDNVSFSYPSRENATALNNLKLIARANQTTALVGSSGSGKSTCVSLLLRYYEPSSGRIVIDGQSISDYKIKQFRQNIGVVSQEPILFGISIYENVRFGKMNATRAEIEQAAEQANAHKFIMKLPNKYETLVGERGIQLSGGEKQRIALARALVKQPSILLLDEATSALDNVSEKNVQEALDRACKNRTTIVVAHRLTTIQNADYIYVLDKGSVIEEGTHETLLAKEGGKYQTMIKMQQSEKTIGTQDGLMNMAKAVAEDEEQLLERVRLLSENETNDINQRSSISTRGKSIFVRLMKMNSPEWMFILIGCLACLFGGLRGPVFSILFAKIINEFNNCKYTDIHRRVLVTSSLFILIGALFMILHFFQYVTFGIAGAKLVSRIRSKAFACFLRQEVAYFDRPENSSGAICNQLSSNAAAIEDMAGTRLGVICETLSLSVFGCLFGFFYNWELTIIIAIAFVIILIGVIIDIRLSSWLKTQSDLIYSQASTLAVEVITNMRTVKQLSMENEVLRQYSNMIDQILIMFWRSEALFAMVCGLYWSMSPLTLGLLYWRALILVENNELDMSDVVMISAFGMFALELLKVVGMLGKRIGASFAAAHAFFDLFDRIPTIDNESNKGQELTNFSGETEFNQVKFMYPTRSAVLVLNKLQLSIKSGQRIALVAVCSPACLNGGTCTQPNFCDCTKDWKGAYCETDNKCYYGKDQVQLVNGEKRSIEYLKVGDRVWSISPDGSSLIEDEIVMMADSGPNTPTMFYTFKTIEGYEVSLTNRHTIPVFDPNDNQIRIVRSSQVTREHYLIMYNKKSAIENISINTRIGFYAPLTLTGYLAVNNISTSVFSDSYRLSQNSFQHAFMPVRVYYHVMRWYFGKTYNPFETNIKEGLHPVVAFYKQHSGTIRTVVLTIENVIPALLIIFILYYIQKIFIRLFYSGLDKSN
ncbi:unnamed protein product [Adineta steineri]|uniref:Uncharacterized protein n=2 Tax=Adineta steineri TaxID=433720 RepID=A0A814R9L7_9BILA|nr:unnamed protein product [Adineta steineri]